MNSNYVGRTKLIKFEASWCAPCRNMSPVIEDVLKDNLDVDLINVDVDDESGQEAVREFNIRSIPTLILLNEKNQIINTLIGTASKDKLREFLSKR